MALADIFKAGADKSINVAGAEASTVATATYTAKCNQVDKNCAVVAQLERANLTEGDHPAGGKMVTVTTNVAGSCYWLPWKGWQAVHGQLGAACDYFVTANLTGCCVVVSGAQNAPYVVHMNCQPGDDDLVPYTGDIAEYNFDMDGARGQFYGQVSGQLVDNNVITSQGLKMLHPSDYFKKSSDGYAFPTSVFGVRAGGNWTIYYNVGKSNGPGITRELYPNFQAL